MRKIWKFPVPVTDELALTLPQGAKLLSVQCQGASEVPCLWTEVDPDALPQARRFSWYGTGHPLPDEPGAYIGTVQLHAGELVFHLYARAD